MGRSAAEDALRRVRGALEQLITRDWFTLLLVILVALGVRLIAIASRPLWYDEAFAVLFAEKGVAAMLRGTLTAENGAAADVHPLAYYTLLGTWMQAFGRSPVAVRFMSVLFGVGTVGLSFLLGRELFGRRVAIFSALLVALAPFQVHYAQEVRMYALLAFLLLLATLAFWKGMKSHRWYWWLIFALAAAFSQYTHNLAAVYLLSLAATPIFNRDWWSLRASFLSGIAAVLIYAPWLIRLPSQLGKINQAYWVARPSVARIFTLLMTYTTNLPLPDYWLAIGLFVTLISLVFATWQTLRAVRHRLPGWKRGLWLAYLALAPALLLWLISQIQPVFIERALLPAGVAYIMWLGWSLSLPGIPRGVRFTSVAILTCGLVVGIWQHIAYAGFPYAPFKELNQSMQTRIREGDLVLHSNKLTALPAVYYTPDLPVRYLGDPPGSGSDTLAAPTQEVLGLWAYPTLEESVEGARRVWFVIFEQAIREYQADGKESHPHLEWLETSYDLKSVEDWDDLQLYLYGDRE